MTQTSLYYIGGYILKMFLDASMVLEFLGNEKDLEEISFRTGEVTMELMNGKTVSFKIHDFFNNEES